MIYARVYSKIPGMVIHKSWRWVVPTYHETKIKNVEPTGVTIVEIKNLNLWAAVGKWKFIHSTKLVLVPISKSEYETDIAFELWPKLTLVRYPNWIWQLKKFGWRSYFYDVRLLFVVSLFVGICMSAIAAIVFLI